MIYIYDIPRYALIIWSIVQLRKLKTANSYASGMISLSMISFISISVLARLSYMLISKVNDIENSIQLINYIAYGEITAYTIAWVFMALGLKSLASMEIFNSQDSEENI